MSFLSTISRRLGLSALFLVGVFLGAALALTASNPSSATVAKLPLIADPWPGQIRYFNDSGYRETLRMAIDRWEQTGIPVQFIEVNQRSEADLVISDDPVALAQKCAEPGCRGHAIVGYNPWDWRENVLYLEPPAINDQQGVVNLASLPVVVHELGHVLGLNHNQRPCSALSVQPDCPGGLGLAVSGKEARFRCHLDRQDLNQLGELYDFKPQVVEPWCRHRGANLGHYRAVSKLLAG